MASDNNPILGDYSFGFVELNNTDALNAGVIGQQAKLRMVIEDITKPTYSNGVLKINEHNYWSHLF